MNIHSTMPARKPAVLDKYEAILSAALSLFVERGFHGTAVPAVARKANIAAGTIYHYFKGKEALVNALFRKWKSAIAERVYTRFPVGAEPREQFRAIWHQMAGFALENPKAFSFLELHHHASYLDDESRAVDASLKKFGVMFVERAQEAGVLKPMEPILLMELVFGAFNGMFRIHVEGRFALDEASIAAAEAACWDAVRVIE
jgi:AcrR family transcriptional regulator